MTRFSATVTSQAVISAPRAEVWAALTDPALLAKLTPLLDHIDAEGDTWTWHMTEVKALGVGISPVFTEAMTFTEGDTESRIDFRHAAPAGTTERSGTEGNYVMTDAEVDGVTATKLDVELTLSVELPLPESAGRPVSRVMESTMNRTGDRFAENLLEHLGARELQPASE